MRRHLRSGLAASTVIAALLCAAAAPAMAEVIGRNVPAVSMTADRVAALPAAEQDAWYAYLNRSIAQRALDRATLAARGEGGVAHVLDLMAAEMRVAMALSGCTRVSDIDRTMIAH